MGKRLGKRDAEKRSDWVGRVESRGLIEGEQEKEASGGFT